MAKNTPIPRIPRFKPRKEPLKAAELNLMVDAINTLALSLENRGSPSSRSRERVKYPFHCQYRYDYDNATGYASVTSGKIIERFLTTESTAPIYHSVNNTWQVPDDPIELSISPDQHVALYFEVDVDGKIVANTPDVRVVNDGDLDTTNWRPKNPSNTTGRTGSYNFSLAKLVVLDDKPNGISNAEWAAFEINAGESHFHWCGERLFDNTTNASNTGEGRVLKGYDETDNKYFFRNIISNNSNSENSGVEISISELTNSVEISASIAGSFGNGVTGFCIWEYEDNTTATTFWQEFQNGILVATGEEPSPYDPGDPKLFVLPILIP